MSLTLYSKQKKGFDRVMNENFNAQYVEGKIYFRTRYNKYPAVQLEFKFPSLTEQCHKDDCDVNVVLQRYMKTGVLPTSQKTPVFGDFSSTPQDYAAAVQLLQDAQERFSSLPSAVRERFGNDPAELLAFLDDPNNAAEAEKLGLIEAAPRGSASVSAEAKNSTSEGGTPEGA